MIDNRLTFKEHLTYIGGKCAATTCALARIIPNLVGSKQKRKQLLMSVLTSIGIYVVPIWVRSMDRRNYRARIKAAYKRSALCKICLPSGV